MTASALPPFRLSATNRDVIIDRIRHAPDGWVVRVSPPPRSLPQNNLFHELCGQIAEKRPVWNGLNMDTDDWKALLVVSHAKATADADAPIRLVPSLEGDGLVQLRESTAKMDKARASSLLEYTLAWAAGQGIELVRYDDRP